MNTGSVPLLRSADILTFDLFVGSLEDIPQIVIVWIVTIAFEKYDAIYLISLAVSIILIIWRSIRFSMTKIDGEYRRQMEQHVTNTLQLTNSNVRSRIGSTSNGER